MTRKVQHQISTLLQKSHEHALIAKFTTDPEARTSNERMARECLEHAKTMIEANAIDPYRPETGYAEAFRQALDELPPNGCMREFPYSRH